MEKKEIQKSVLKDGKPLDLSKFMWDDKTNRFSSSDNGLTLYFSDIHDATISCGGDATITCGNFATINCGDFVDIRCGDYATINCGDYFNISCGDHANIFCGSGSIIECGEKCVVVRRYIHEIFRFNSQKIQIASYSVPVYEEVK